MRICSKCGEPLETGATRCEKCGSTSVTISFAPSAPKQDPEEASGPDAAAAPAEDERGGDGEEESESSPWFDWAQRPWFWMAVVVFFAAAFAGAWWVHRPRDQAPTPQPTPSPLAVAEEVKARLDLLVEDLLRSRLEWAREVMVERIPTRFPEELTYHVQNEPPTVTYETEARETIGYAFEISYHFKQTKTKIWEWYPVEIYFEQRNGEWVRVGDKWPRAWDLHFE